MTIWSTLAVVASSGFSDEQILLFSGDSPFLYAQVSVATALAVRCAWSAVCHAPKPDLEIGDIALAAIAGAVLAPAHRLELYCGAEPSDGARGRSAVSEFVLTEISNRVIGDLVELTMEMVFAGRDVLSMRDANANDLLHVIEFYFRLRLLVTDPIYVSVG